jgi:hypothetical protein
MRKLAIFCEGQTEQIFLENLISEIAEKKSIIFHSKKLADKGLITLKEKQGKNESARYFVLIVDCGNDEKVKSAVLDQREALQRNGYHLLLGVRDLYPSRLSDLKTVKSKLKYGVPTAGLPTHILLAVAEIEAWFLQEYKHYAKIKSQLDYRKFKTNFGFDPLTESAETVPAPAALLHEIYASEVGREFRVRTIAG